MNLAIANSLLSNLGLINGTSKYPIGYDHPWLVQFNSFQIEHKT